MSPEKIFTWHPAEPAFKFIDTDNSDFDSGANGSFASVYPTLIAGSAHGLAAGDPMETLPASDAGAANVAAAEPSFLDELHNARIRTAVAGELGADDSLDYQGMLHVLRDAARGGMTDSKFGSLETLVSLMNAPDGISTSAYVQHISHSLVAGDPANADWTGGEPESVPLGNLSADSKQADVHELIGKWFLGTDLPSTAHTGSEATYELQKGPLFADGVPTYHDVNQGDLGDCWFVATLAEVALQDPSAIKSMITNNHNGTYGVRFFVDGHTDYVTVNKELPVSTDGLEFNNGSTLKFANGADGDPLWAELVEKAFAQLNAEPDAVHGTLDKAINAYEGIAGGEADDALNEITGQKSVVYTSDQLVADAATIGAAFDSGEEVELGTETLPKSYRGHDLVKEHVFEVIGYDESTDSFTLHNPWGSAQESPKTPMTFTMSAQQLADNGCLMTVAQGPAFDEHATAHADIDAHAAMDASLASMMGASHGPVSHFLL
jgi:Calpain family cysteine protease